MIDACIGLGQAKSVEVWQDENFSRRFICVDWVMFSVAKACFR
jgi:hypothetical protein